MWSARGRGSASAHLSWEGLESSPPPDAPHGDGLVMRRSSRSSRLTLQVSKPRNGSADSLGILIVSDEDDTSQRLHTDYLPSLATQSVDPVGAGDVFLATTALADLCDAPLAHSIYLGSAMAALHVGILGNDPPTAVDLRTYLAERQELRS